MISIEELMTTNPRTLSPEHSLAQLRDLMRKEHIRHVPIVEDGRLVGLVTERDALGAMDSLLDTPDDDKRRQSEAMVKISEFMTRDPKCIRFDNLAGEALRILRENKIDQIPVIDEDRKPIGLLDVQDLLTVRIV